MSSTGFPLITTFVLTISFSSHVFLAFDQSCSHAIKLQFCSMLCMFSCKAIARQLIIFWQAILLHFPLTNLTLFFCCSYINSLKSDIDLSFKTIAKTVNKWLLYCSFAPFRNIFESDVTCRNPGNKVDIESESWVGVLDFNVENFHSAQSCNNPDSTCLAILLLWT